MRKFLIQLNSFCEIKLTSCVFLRKVRLRLIRYRIMSVCSLFAASFEVLSTNSIKNCLQNSEIKFFSKETLLETIFRQERHFIENFKNSTIFEKIIRLKKFRFSTSKPTRIGFVWSRKAASKKTTFQKSKRRSRKS